MQLDQLSNIELSSDQLNINAEAIASRSNVWRCYPSILLEASRTVFKEQRLAVRHHPITRLAVARNLFTNLLLRVEERCSVVPMF